MSGTGALPLAVSALCGIGFGYAAQRGSLCVVRGVEEWVERRSARQLIAFFQCSLWVALATVPLVWLSADAHLAAALPTTAMAVAGGLLFGAGAALNGGCSFGTIIRLGAGDASYLATLAGMAIGIATGLHGGAGWARPNRIGPSPLEMPTPAGLVLLAAIAVVLIRQMSRGKPAIADPARWPPERAAAVMGLTGGLLYALNGPWAFTVAIERGLGAMMAGGIASPALALVFAGSIGGAAIGAWQRRAFTARLNARAMPARLAAGTVMGMAASLIPGGNDALVLHAIPALSPHVLVAYPALVAGAAAMLLGRRASSWSKVASTTPLRTLRSIISRKTSGRE